MTAPLTTLTDRDLLMNLWLTILMLNQAIGIETEECEQTLLRDGQEPQADAPVITLAQLMAEVESRLNLTGGLDGFKQGRVN